MTVQENLKVYELAKELGMDSISLVDKLKSLEIRVRSHMSSLTKEDANTARTALTVKPEKSATKTKTVRRKASPSTAKKKTASATKKTETKTKAKKKAVLAKPQEAAPSVASVIRRRAKTSEEGLTASAENLAKLHVDPTPDPVNVESFEYLNDSLSAAPTES